jgi:hypothetical protein
VEVFATPIVIATEGGDYRVGLELLSKKNVKDVGTLTYKKK